MKLSLKQIFGRISPVVFLGGVFLMEKMFMANVTLAQEKSVKLNNPLEVESIEGLLEALLAIVIVLAAPIIVFFIIYAGFLYVTARGNAEQVTQATRALTYAVIGGVLIIGAVAIAAIVSNLVESFKA